MADIRKAIPGPMRGARTTGSGHGMTALFRPFVRCVRASVAIELALLTPVILFMLIGLIDWMGFSTTWIDVDRPAREQGETKYGLMKMFRLALDAADPSAAESGG